MIIAVVSISLLLIVSIATNVSLYKRCNELFVAMDKTIEEIEETLDTLNDHYAGLHAITKMHVISNEPFVQQILMHTKNVMQSLLYTANRIVVHIDKSAIIEDETGKGR